MDDRQAVTRGVLGLGKLGLDPLAIPYEYGSQLGLVTHGLDAPATIGPGAKSPPIASRAIRIASLPLARYHPENESGSKRRRDAAAGSISQLRIPRGIKEAATDPIRPLPSLGLGSGLDHAYRPRSPAWLD